MEIFMTPYQNLNGNSGIVSYAITEDSIHVVFKSGTHCNYLYNQQRPGKAVVDRMKALAAQGYGLNSYISTVIKNSYAKKW
jgi:hypothetical protein